MQHILIYGSCKINLTVKQLIISVKAFVLLGLIYLPLLSFPFGYEPSKVYFFFILSIFCGVVLLFKIGGGNITKFATSNKALIFWFIWLLVATLFSDEVYFSLIGFGYRHQGLAFFLSLILFGLFFYSLSQGLEKFFAKGLVIVALIESAIIVIQKLSGLGMSIDGRPIGTFGEANAAAGFIALSSVFFYSLLKNKKLYWITQIFLSLSLLVSGSRSAVLAFIAILFLLHIKRVKNFKQNILIFSVIVLGFITVFSINRPVSVFEARLQYWQIAIEKIASRPLTGFGPEAIAQVYSDAYLEKNIPLYKLIIDRSHNLFLDIGLMSGVVGLVLFSVWIAGTLTKSKRDKYKLAGLVGFLVFSFFQPVGVVHWVYLMWISGIDQKERKNKTHHP